MMPSTPSIKVPRLSLGYPPAPKVNITNSSFSSTSTPSSKKTLSEWSLNETVDVVDAGAAQVGSPRTNPSNMISEIETRTLHLNVEILHKLQKEKRDVKEFIEHNMGQSGSLEINGWSNNKSIPDSLYEEILKPEFKIRKLVLRGRGTWDTCHCPKKTSTMGELIDTITEGNTTNLEHLYIMRTFTISACALLDLIARSPKLKVFRFYGVLTKEEHHEAFKFIRFLSELERVYWPWCSRKHHLPALKTLVKRHDKIDTFYSSAETICDLLSSDILQNIRHLSLILNEDWNCKPFNTKKAARYLKKIAYLSQAKKLEALEVRSIDPELDDESGCQETNTAVRRLYENFQLSFWEHVAKLKNLKYLAVYGSWELDKVTRELARHGIQIEYFKTNLIPSSMMPAVDARENNLILSIHDSIKNLGKLAKLRSLNYTCHENLTGIDSASVAAIKELCDLIWVLDVRTAFTAEVEDLLTNMLRRANTISKGYKIKLHVENANTDYANIYLEARPKFSTQSLRERLTALVSAAAKARSGKATFKAFHFWGIEQEATPRDRTAFEQLKSTWMHYDDIFEPIDQFI